MTETKLKHLVAEAVSLDREITLQQDRLKDLKAQLVSEARERLDGSGGNAIAFAGLDGEIARVNLPAPSLKSKIDPEGKPFEKLKSAAGANFGALFMQTVTYVPVEGFRIEATTLLGPAAGKLIRLCETESHPRVSFETKQK